VRRTCVQIPHLLSLKVRRVSKKSTMTFQTRRASIVYISQPFSSVAGVRTLKFNTYGHAMFCQRPPELINARQSSLIPARARLRLAVLASARQGPAAVASTRQRWPALGSVRQSPSARRSTTTADAQMPDHGGRTGPPPWPTRMRRCRRNTRSRSTRRYTITARTQVHYYGRHAYMITAEVQIYDHG
jgi:hypothetical protein